MSTYRTGGQPGTPSIALSSARARTAVDSEAGGTFGLPGSRIEPDAAPLAQNCARPYQIGCSEDASCNASLTMAIFPAPGDAAHRLSISVSARATSPVIVVHQECW